MVTKAQGQKPPGGFGSWAVLKKYENIMAGVLISVNLEELVQILVTSNLNIRILYLNLIYLMD